MAWISLVFLCLLDFFGFQLGMISVMAANRPGVNLPNMTTTNLDVYRALLRLSPRASPITMVLYSIQAVGTLVAGGLGLAFAIGDRLSIRPSTDVHPLKEVIYKR